MAPSSTSQGITGQQAGAAVGEQDVGIWAWRVEDQALARAAQHETADKLPMAVGSSALDGKRGSTAQARAASPRTLWAFTYFLNGDALLF